MTALKPCQPPVEPADSTSKFKPLEKEIKVNWLK